MMPHTEELAKELQCAFEALHTREFKLAIDIAKRLLQGNIRFAPAHYLIGRVALETGPSELALKGLEIAADLDPTNSEYWAFLAIAYSQIGNLVKAEQAVLKANQIGSENAHVLHAISHVLSVLGLFDEAIICLKRAVKIAPESGIIHHALGVSLLESGDFIGAQNALNTAVTINENDAKSWWILSSLLKAESNDLPEKLLAKVKLFDAFPQQQAYLGYAAGKLFEDTKSWDRAYQAYETGASAKRRIVNYKQADAQNTFQAIKSVCTEAWMRNVDYPCNSDSAPIFVIGQPRTGTTMVDRILSSHSKVHSAGEPLQLAMSLRTLTGVKTEEFISAELIHHARDLAGQTLAESYLAGLANLKGNKPYFVDKLPMNFMLVGFIVKAFPNAKIIHLTRSPADTCFANFKQLFGDVYQHSYQQREMAEHYVMYRDLMQHWHRVLPGKIYDIAYEDIIEDTDNQARGLIQYVGLEWEESCSRFENNKLAVVTASATQVRERVHNRSVGRWKNFDKQLTPTIEILEAAGISP